jgi:hypothetical protein
MLYTLLYQPFPLAQVSELPQYKTEGQIYFPYDVKKVIYEIILDCIGISVIAQHSGHGNSDSRLAGTIGQSTNGNGRY